MGFGPEIAKVALHVSGGNERKALELCMSGSLLAGKERFVSVCIHRCKSKQDFLLEGDTDGVQCSLMIISFILHHYYLPHCLTVSYYFHMGQFLASELCFDLFSLSWERHLIHLYSLPSPATFGLPSVLESQDLLPILEVGT